MPSVLKSGYFRPEFNSVWCFKDGILNMTDGYEMESVKVQAE